jgi:hypothetical protein
VSNIAGDRSAAKYFIDESGGEVKVGRYVTSVVSNIMQCFNALAMSADKRNHVLVVVHLDIVEIIASTLTISEGGGGNI